MSGYLKTIKSWATDYVEMTAVLVSAYVANNHLQADKIASLIASTDAALTGLGQVHASATAPV